MLANTSVGLANVTVGGTGTSTMNGSGGIHLQGVQIGAVASTLNGGLDVDAGTVLLNTPTGATTFGVGGEVVPASVVIDANQQANRLGNLATVMIGAMGSMSINEVNAIPNHANSVAFTVENGGNLRLAVGSKIFTRLVATP